MSVSSLAALKHLQVSCPESYMKPETPCMLRKSCQLSEGKGERKKEAGKGAGEPTGLSFWKEAGKEQGKPEELASWGSPAPDNVVWEHNSWS